MNEPKTPIAITPDPGWDYYLPWHQLLQAKAMIDKALEVLSKAETANKEVEEESIYFLIESVGLLEGIREEFTDDSDYKDDEDI